MEQEKKRELTQVAEEFKADENQIQEHNNQLLNELTVQIDD